MIKFKKIAKNSVEIALFDLGMYFLQDFDDESRVHEAVTRAVMCAMMSQAESVPTEQWLNPTEVTTQAAVIQLLTLILSIPIICLILENCAKHEIFIIFTCIPLHVCCYDPKIHF